MDALRAAGFIAQFPHAGEAIAGTSVRKWRVAHTPYVLLYRPSRHMIEIARLVHHARDWTRFV
jgi:plasmid stabilization system protein ParE